LSGSTQITRNPSHNTGGFLQTQIGIKERLVLTYGLRAEWNPAFGKEALPNLAPRYGAAYTQEWGQLTAKLRAAYGRSTRPPNPEFKRNMNILRAFGGDPEMQSIYGNVDYRAGNPELGPEFQQGGEGGVEVYWGSRASLSVTRYNQTVDGLIESSGGEDSLRSLAPNPTLYGITCQELMSYGITIYCSSTDADGYWYVPQGKYRNIASIRNQGWELTGSVQTGPITTRGTYSWTKSRSLGVTPKYQRFFAGKDTYYEQFRKGATFQYLPEHTWAMGITYATAATTLSLNLNGTGQLRNGRSKLFHDVLALEIRLDENRQRMMPYPFAQINPAYSMADLNGSHRFSSRLEAVFQVQNLTDFYTNDSNSLYAVMGRQTKAGFRIRL
jgi:outer membrane cobalamin receptor